METTTFGCYDRLRRDLAALQYDFSAMAGDFPEVFAERISPLGPALTKEQWQAFFEFNSHSNCEWQYWQLCADGISAYRFSGCEGSIELLHRWSKQVMTLLRQIEDLVNEKQDILPANLELSLPNGDDLCAWLDLVFSTASCYATPTCAIYPRFWGHSGQVTFEEETQFDRCGNGIEFPLKPFYEELRCGLFNASEEAIRIWLDPTEAEWTNAATPPVILPFPPEHDGPEWPDAFCLHGKRYEGLTPLELRLLECLWGKSKVSLDEAVKYVYASDVEQKEGAIISLKKHLSGKMAAKGIPADVHFQQGFIYLKVSSSV